VGLHPIKQSKAIYFIPGSYIGKSIPFVPFPLAQEGEFYSYKGASPPSDNPQTRQTRVVKLDIEPYAIFMIISPIIRARN
jgi:hypothetical protein